MTGYHDYDDLVQGYMSLGDSDPEPADRILWNLSGEDAYDALGAYLKSDDRIVYQILVREVVR